MHVVLVHNLGHRELYLRLQNEKNLRKPNSNAQHSLGRDLWAQLEKQSEMKTSMPGEVTLTPAASLGWPEKILRRRLHDAQGNGPEHIEGIVQSVAFPLVESAIQSVVQDVTEEIAQMEVILVSSGPSVSESEGHASLGRSTEHIARIVQRYVQIQWPAVKVSVEHRDTEHAFTFANSPDLVLALEQRIQGARRPVVDAHGEDWSDHFSVYLSANTGTISDISSMLEGLRPHRPSLVHMPTAYKWPEDGEHTLVVPEASILDRDALRQQPARAIESIQDPVIQLAVQEMHAWRAQFVQARPLRANDDTIDKENGYWFRKGRKEVLALLVVEDPNNPDTLHTYRGVNVEVSLPTGTLCAERNAIGTAFASHPDMMRRHIRAVAVLSLDTGIGARLGPCGACTEWLRKVDEVNPDFRVVTFADETCSHVFVRPIQAAE